MGLCRSLRDHGRICFSTLSNCAESVLQDSHPIQISMPSRPYSDPAACSPASSGQHRQSITSLQQVRAKTQSPGAAKSSTVTSGKNTRLCLETGASQGVDYKMSRTSCDAVLRMYPCDLSQDSGSALAGPPALDPHQAASRLSAAAKCTRDLRGREGLRTDFVPNCQLRQMILSD